VRLLAERLHCRLLAPTAALPLDIFRIAVGLLAFAYFARTLAEAGDISSPDGLIDHEFSLRVLWFTRLGLFQTGITAGMLRSIFASACLLSVFVTIGFRVKLAAAVLYLIAVSTYRWNYLVTYVDDSIVHLLLFWLILLPVGHTLVLHRARHWDEWKHKLVPGTAMRCLLWNVALLYLVAGLWKWASPMWRSGTALLAVLQLPIAYAPAFWGPDQLTMLHAMNYLALVLETAFPLLLILPVGHWLKYALLAALVAFHGGIIGTLRIPFANLACLAAIPLLLRHEIMRWLLPRGRREQTAAAGARGDARMAPAGRAALLFVSTLTLAMASSVTLPNWRGAKHPDGVVEGLGPAQLLFFSALWSVGMAQQYQLFNWIDDRNYSVEYEVYRSSLDAPLQPASVEAIFPRSIRSVLLQGYLFGVSWAQIPASEQPELKRSLYSRFARRYCRTHAGGDEVSVYSKVRRVTRAHPLAGPVERALMMRFRCDPDRTRLLTLNPVSP
jgi:hypothetical protein